MSCPSIIRAIFSLHSCHNRNAEIYTSSKIISTYKSKSKSQQNNVHKHTCTDGHIHTHTTHKYQQRTEKAKQRRGVGETQRKKKNKRAKKKERSEKFPALHEVGGSFWRSLSSFWILLEAIMEGGDQGSL
jgi:hypothetical protein